ncbi:MAG TPA: RNA polymerase sigma factor SigJ [Thermoleophilaceae bacterium]|nr:RNA polymerase sigma factor SigJ [Thermoleophilaceae bacterium]
MTQAELVTAQFESERPRLRGVAYRMLGSLSEAEDAVQEAWLRLNRSDTEAVENLGGWLTTVVARVCLDMLRTRRARREEYVGGPLPDPVIGAEDERDPEHEALLADAVGLALQVVLDQLSPPERLAFVLHDMFGVSFDEIAPIVDRTPAAARKLASRARGRVRGAAPAPDPDLRRQREVVDAFLAAARAGDFEGLLAVLDPDVVLRADAGANQPELSGVIHGSRAVAERALIFSRPARDARAVLVNGAVGMAGFRDGHLVSVGGFIVADGKIVEIDILADAARLRGFDASGLGD